VHWSWYVIYKIIWKIITCEATHARAPDAPACSAASACAGRQAPAFAGLLRDAL